MTIPALSAISGVTPLAGFASVGDVTPLSNVARPGGTGSAGATAAGSVNFSDALAKVQGQIDGADGLAQQLATGQLSDIHSYTVAASKAQLGVQLTVALRNQLLGAYQEIMRMQV